MLWLAGNVSESEEYFLERTLRAILILHYFPLVTSFCWLSTHVWTAALCTAWSIVGTYAGVFMPLCSGNACREGGRWRLCPLWHLSLCFKSVPRMTPLCVIQWLPSCHWCVYGKQWQSSWFLQCSAPKQLRTVQNVFGTQHTWIVALRYASFSHGKSCHLCLCSAVPLAMGQLSCKLGRERESSQVELYFKLFWVFMEVIILIWCLEKHLP